MATIDGVDDKEVSDKGIETLQKNSNQASRMKLLKVKEDYNEYNYKF